MSRSPSARRGARKAEPVVHGEKTAPPVRPCIVGVVVTPSSSRGKIRGALVRDPEARPQISARQVFLEPGARPCARVPNVSRTALASPRPRRSAADGVVD